MSKKQKRRVSSSESVVRESHAKATAAPTGRYASSSSEFNPDYTPIIKDLKRIGILAGSFFAVLIILSFFLR
ncbi:MAG: hypothetical protein AB1457_10970 [Chloroflexota bacterium]|nr:MAG: hypothetical protein KatS3mg047_0187 [Bellilinea sp.]